MSEYRNGILVGTVSDVEEEADAKGDILVATADDTLANLGVGTDDQMIVADSAEPTGLKWQDIPAAAAHASDHTDGTDDIQDAAADDSTKGIATFEADDFDSASGKIDLANSVAKSVSGDSGSATPSAHALTIAGGTNVTTSATGSTVTINASGGGSGQLLNHITNSGFGVWSRSTLENYGTQITVTDITSGVCTTSNTQDLKVGSLFRFDSGDFSGNVYEVTGVVADTNFTVNDTSITDSGSPGTGYEATPGCLAADALACDGWYKDTTLDLHREPHGDNTTGGSYYSLRCAPSAANDYIRWPSVITSTRNYHLAKYQGKDVVFGAWVKSSTASHARLRIYDGATTTASSYHTGGGDWEWLEVTATVASDASTFYVEFDFTQSSGITYASQPMLSLGTSIGSGNYTAPLGEIIYFEKVITSNALHGLTAQSDAGPVNLFSHPDSNGIVPKGAKAVYINVSVRDSGSSGGSTVLLLRADADQSISFTIDPSGIANDTYTSQTGWNVLDPELTAFDYYIYASGAGTFDIIYFRYLGVQF